MKNSTVFLLTVLSSLEIAHAQQEDTLVQNTPLDTLSGIALILPDTLLPDSLSISEVDTGVVTDESAAVANDTLQSVPLEVVFSDSPISGLLWISPWWSDCAHGCGGPTECFYRVEETTSIPCAHYTDLPDTDSITQMLPSSDKNLEAVDPNNLSSQAPDGKEETPAAPLLPDQPWYQAVLPVAIRMKKHS